MTATLDAASLKTAICNLTEVEATNQGFEISLPQMYHSGKSVVVVVSRERHGFVVHDNSYAAMLLSNAGLAPGKRLADGLRTQVAEYGCDIEGLRIVRRCDEFGQLAVSMALVGSASRLIADQALKADRPPLQDFKSSLLGKVVALVGRDRVRTNEEVSGHLGSRYRVSAMILDVLLAKPVAFIEPIADREAIARRFKQFYDLKATPEYESVDRVAVYDETNPLPSGDALLLEEVGNLVRFVDVPARLKPWMTVQ